MQTVIYRILHAASGRCYLGHTTNWRLRERQHRSLLIGGKHHSPYLQHAWNKYGADAFLFEIMEACEEDAKLVREQWWIDNSNSVFNYAKVAGSRKGVPQSAEANEKVRRAHLGKKRSAAARLAMSLGSMGKPGTRNGKKHTAESRALMSIAQKAIPHPHLFGRKLSPESIEKNRASNKANKTRAFVGMLGKRHSEESRQKMSASLTGRKQSAETIAKRKASIAAFHANRSPEWLVQHAATISAAKQAKKRARLLEQNNQPSLDL